MKANALVTVSILGAGLTCLAAGTSEAGRNRHVQNYDGYVVADSRYGHGSVNGAVRDTSVGPQVQLPSGSWVYCRRSCSETLRVETVDRFENPGINFGATTLQAECGVFGCLDIR